MEVDRTVGAELAEIGRPAVVLIDDDTVVGHHDQRRVTPRSVGDRRLDVDRHAETGCDLGLDGVDGADELGEAECRQRALLLTRREAGKQDRDVATQVFGEPGFVVVVAVEVGDVQEVGVLDAVLQVVAQLIVSGEREPRAEEGRLEPRITENRSPGGLDEHAGMTDGGDLHTPCRLWPPHGSGVERRGETWRSVDQATGGSVYCWPARLTCSVQALPSQ